MRRRDADRDISWYAAQVLDAYRSCTRLGLSSRFCAMVGARFDRIVNELTVPPMHNEVFGVSFFSDLASLKDAMQYILSKTLNERCQSRKFGEVVLRCYDADSTVAGHIRKLVLCSLLGNYKQSSAVTRPRGIVRDRLYEVLCDQSVRYNGWFRSLLVEGRGLLVQCCLREFLVFSIRDSPALAANVRDLINLDQFASITSRAIDGIRVYFDRRLSEPFSVLSRSLSESSSDGSVRPLTAWYTDVEPILSQCQKAMLGISYRRPKRTLQQCFLTVQKKLAPVTNPHLVDIHTRRSDTETLTKSTADADIGLSVQHLSELQSVGGIEKGSSRSETGSSPSALSLSTVPFEHLISREQLDALTEVLRSILRCTSYRDALPRFLPLMCHFGVDQSVVDFVLTLNEPGTSEKVLSDERLRKRLQLLHQEQAHAYNLIQVAVHIIEDYHRVRSVSELPVQYWRNQIDAIQGRFGIRPESGMLLRSMLYFVYCDVCGMVYSLLRDPHSVYKQSYTFGYRDVVVDYDTDAIYCHKRKSGYNGRCGARELCRVFLLGQVISYGRQIILLCPQAGCGMPMVYDPAYCIFNERGVACVDCTRAAHLARSVERERYLLETHVAPLDQCVSCVLCGQQLIGPRQMVLYPYQTVVCRHHANSAMRKAVKPFHAVRSDPEDGAQLVEWRSELIEMMLRIDSVKQQRQSFTSRSKKVRYESTVPSRRIFSHKTKHLYDRAHRRVDG